MRYQISAVSLAALAMGMIGVVATPPSAAAASTIQDKNTESTVSQHVRARSYFVLSKRTANSSGSTTTRVVTLTCEPTGGSHPRAATVCAELLSRDGALEIPASDTVCTTEYAPVKVNANGYWRNNVERLSRTYGNNCVMRSRTGSLFDF